MIMYEVNLKIAVEVYDSYRRWLLPHLQEMLQFQGFTSAKVLEQLDEDDGSFRLITVQYTVTSMDDLNAYLDNHATTMREDALRQFPGKFTANRRVFIVQDEIFF